MKMKHYIIGIALLTTAISCQEEPTAIDFGVDTSLIKATANGGVHNIEIAADELWTAEASTPWIAVSPANGKGSIKCEIMVDSTLVAEPRRGVIRIKSATDASSIREIEVQQLGYDYSITVAEPEVTISNFKVLEDRYFDVEVSSNVEFDVEVPEDAKNWLSYSMTQPTLDRGLRPRKTKVRFNWDINSRAEERLAQISFKPKSSVELTQNDLVKISQQAGEYIPVGTPKGDSLSLFAVARALKMSYIWDGALPMSRWQGIELWESDMEGYTADKEGRVRSAAFTFIDTKEGIPYEIQNLTAMETLSLFSNSNSMDRSIDAGDHLSNVVSLKNLTIFAYGIKDLPASFAKLENLESLDISVNNMQRIPAVLTKENFPKLRTLNLGANPRGHIQDLSNAVDTSDIGGFFSEPEFPAHLLEWGLESLSLSINYLQGKLPSMEHMERYKAGDVVSFKVSDDADAETVTIPIPDELVGEPKVMPTTRTFRINGNRLIGSIPTWLLYHPMLDYWDPFTLVFNQGGIDAEGNVAGFDNEPANFDYYYKAYPSKLKSEDDE